MSWPAHTPSTQVTHTRLIRSINYRHTGDRWRVGDQLREGGRTAVGDAADAAAHGGYVHTFSGATGGGGAGGGAAQLRLGGLEAALTPSSSA